MTRIDTEKYDHAVEPTGDGLHRLARAAIGLIPVGSGTALEVLNLFIQEPLQKRRTQWLHDLSMAVNSMGGRLDEVESHIRRHSAVLSAILQSTDIALRTGDAAIHQRLITMVLNTIKEQAPNEELLSLYLTTISRLTSSHLELLNFISSRQRYEDGNELGAHEQKFLREIEARAGISPAIPKTRLLNDLESLTLIYSPAGSPESISGSTNYCTKAVTSFGLAFMDHISSTAS